MADSGANKPEASERAKEHWKKVALVRNAARRFRLASDGDAFAGRSRRGSSFASTGDETPLSRKSSESSGPGGSFRRPSWVKDPAFTPDDSTTGGKQVTIKIDDHGFGLSPEKLETMLELPHGEENRAILDGLGGVTGIANLLKTDTKAGVPESAEDHAARKEVYGTNTYPEQPPKQFWEYVWDACQDTTLLILVMCGVGSLPAGMLIEDPAEGWYEGAGILFACIIVVTVTAVNDYQQDLQFRDLDSRNKDIEVSVVRGGTVKKISLYDLMAGDVVTLATGDQICSDGVLIEAQELAIDESSMTGESLLVKKSHALDPFMLSGTKVADGYGKFLVTCVGTKTEWGRLMASGTDPDAVSGQIERLERQKESGEISEEQFEEQKTALEEAADDSHETPLQIRLSGLATNIGKLGLAVAILVFIVLMARFIVTVVQDGSTKDDAKTVLEIFAIAVTIVVVAVPEGLPLAVTLSLAYSMKKMMNDQALVRHLKACETMGGATTICSDKTGTLTTNNMTVTRAMAGGKVLDKQNDKGKPANDVASFSKDAVALIGESLFGNAEGIVYPPDETSNGEPVITGKPTEVAILRYGVALGLIFDDVTGGLEKLKVDPFNSAKKRSGTAMKNATGAVRVHWKGASEIILGMCSKELKEDESEQEMSEARRTEILDLIAEMAAGTLRTLCVAYTSCPSGTTFGEDDELPDSGLTLLLLVGIKDPCRPGVPEAVLRCQRAGVVVRMVTGDNVTTAKAIARECHILSDDGMAVEGAEFRKMTNAERLARFGPRLEKLQVMARSSPSDKYDLVHMLRNLGDVVGVTGDGTNDARALKEADIGLSMGIAGTQVAQKSSDIVVLDDNFASISTIIRWGRSVYSNIQKFVQFQLTVNIVALTLNFIAAIVLGHVPLNAVQLLWVNLIMDTMGALALATEPPREELMNRKPYGRTEPLISPVMWRNILVQAAFQLVVLFIYVFAGYELWGLEEVKYKMVAGDDGIMNKVKLTHHESLEQTDTRTLNSIIFNTFVFCQIFNEINARRMEELNVMDGFFANSYFINIIVITCVCQVILVELLGAFADTVPLSWQQWLICVAVGSLAMPLAVLGKFIPIPDTSVFDRFASRAAGADTLESEEVTKMHMDRIAELEKQVDELKSRAEKAEAKVSELTKK